MSCVLSLGSCSSQPGRHERKSIQQLQNPKMMNLTHRWMVERLHTNKRRKCRKYRIYLGVSPHPPACKRVSYMFGNINDLQQLRTVSLYDLLIHVLNSKAANRSWRKGNLNLFCLEKSRRQTNLMFPGKGHFFVKGPIIFTTIRDLATINGIPLI